MIELNAEVIRFYFEEYGVILTVRNPDRLLSDDIVFSVRKATSGPLRHKYLELAKMPSLWTRTFYCEDGYLNDTMMKKIQAYYSILKSRS